MVQIRPPFPRFDLCWHWFQTISAHFGSFLATWAILDDYETILVYSEPFCTIWEHFRTFRTILATFESIQTFLGHFSLLRTILVYFGLFWVMSDHFEPFQAYLGLWTHLGQRIILGHLGTISDHYILFRPF